MGQWAMAQCYGRWAHTSPGATECDRKLNTLGGGVDAKTLLDPHPQKASGGKDQHGGKQSYEP